MNSLRITNTKAHSALWPAAMTLIELAVVIGLIMTLLGVLLIGYRFYVENCQRCECLVLQSQAQKSYRSYVALHQQQAQLGVPAATLIAEGIHELSQTDCKSGGVRAYQGAGGLVPLGQRVFPCQGVAAVEHAPEAKDLASW